MNPLESLIQQLSQQAGPRGFTFAGRAMQPGDSFLEALQRFPQAEAETGGLAMQSPELLKVLIGGGVFKELLHQRFSGAYGPSGILQKIAPELADKIRKAAQYQSSVAGPPTDVLLTELQRLPQFRRFQELVAQNLRRVYGERVPFFRGLYPDELVGWRGAGKIGAGQPSILPGSLQEDIGRSFASARGGPMLKATVRPEDALYHSFGRNMWFPEREIGVRPGGLIDPVIHQIQALQNPWRTATGAPDELLTEILRSMISKGQY